MLGYGLGPVASTEGTDKQDKEQTGQGKFHFDGKKPSARIVMLPVHNAHDHRGHKCKKGQGNTMVCCASQIFLAEFQENNTEDESADDQSHWYMSRWGVDWMSVANSSKNLIEEIDHVLPLSQKCGARTMHMGQGSILL